MSGMLRSAAAVLAAFALVAALPSCPCLPQPTAPASAHDCCAPVAGVRAASHGCCESVPSLDAAPAAPAPAAAAPVVVATLSPSPLVSPAAFLPRATPAAPSPPPLVLRI
jgi:hypothetical protein